MDKAPLHERLAHLANEFLEVANAPRPYNVSLAGYLRDHAYSLAEFAKQCEDEYVRVRGGEEEGVPTVAQGVALARFMRGRAPARHASVTVGGAGLPDDYLHVRLLDGYEGGIAPDGSVST